jgi:hypothetical protein
MEPLNVSYANGIPGESYGEPKSTDVRRERTMVSQLAGTSGAVQHRAATWRMRLKSEGRRFDPAP